MKSLSLDRPLVMIMLGVPGAGKSYFARQFAETFSAPLVHYDRIRYELFAAPQFNKEEEAVVERIALNQIEELFKTKRTFLVDGVSGARVSRARIEQLAHKHGYGRLIVWVQTDDPTAKARSARRIAGRQFDEYNMPLAPEAYEKLAKKLTPPAPHEPTVVISGKHLYATQLKIVLKKLTSEREVPVTTPDAPGSTPRPHPTPTGDRPTPPTRRSVPIQ